MDFFQTVQGTCHGSSLLLYASASALASGRHVLLQNVESRASDAAGWILGLRYERELAMLRAARSGVPSRAALSLAQRIAASGAARLGQTSRPGAIGRPTSATVPTQARINGDGLIAPQLSSTQAMHARGTRTLVPWQTRGVSPQWCCVCASEQPLRQTSVLVMHVIGMVSFLHSDAVASRSVVGGARSG